MAMSSTRTLWRELRALASRLAAGGSSGLQAVAVPSKKTPKMYPTSRPPRIRPRRNHLSSVRWGTPGLEVIHSAEMNRPGSIANFGNRWGGAPTRSKLISNGDY